MVDAEFSRLGIGVRRQRHTLQVVLPKNAPRLGIEATHGGREGRAELAAPAAVDLNKLGVCGGR